MGLYARASAVPSERDSWSRQILTASR